MNSSTTTDETLTLLHKVLDVEAQVLRDGFPLTRPTRWAMGLQSFAKPGMWTTWKLFPGATNRGELVNVSLANCGYTDSNWILVSAALSIDGVAFPDIFPGSVFVNMDTMWPHDGWSCVINFPRMGAPGGPFAGIHSLLLRTHVIDEVTR